MMMWHRRDLVVRPSCFDNLKQDCQSRGQPHSLS